MDFSKLKPMDYPILSDGKKLLFFGEKHTGKRGGVML